MLTRGIRGGHPVASERRVPHPYPCSGCGTVHFAPPAQYACEDSHEQENQ